MVSAWFGVPLALAAFGLSSSERDESPRAPIGFHLDGAPLDDGEGDDGAPNAPAPANSCVRVTTRVRYSMGYDHWVDLQNDCEKSVNCSVSTNVNPEKRDVHLSPGDSASVLSFRGSPAREFTPRVTCQY